MANRNNLARQFRRLQQPKPAQAVQEPWLYRLVQKFLKFLKRGR